MVEPQKVLAEYEIGEICEVQVAGGTAGKCWRVESTTGRYFLRRRGPRTSSPDALQFDHGFRRHLLARGVPTAAPIATRRATPSTRPAGKPAGRRQAKACGTRWVVMEGHAYELYPLVEGGEFGGSRRELVETARALARFHQAAADYPARGSFSPIRAQFAMATPEVGGSERMDDPQVMAAAFELLAGDARLAVHEPSLGYAVEQAGRLAEEYDASVYRALPRWLIHGDYHPGNLLYSDSGKVLGIFDLDWACEHTRSRDLADGVYYFGGRRAQPFDGASILSMTEAVEPDIDNAALFVLAYREVAPLAPEEVEAIPLALRGRVLAERLEGSAKVPPEQRAWFISRELERPLEWVHAHGDALVRALR